MNEIWKTIDGYNNYKVSNYGNVMNIKTHKLLNGQNNGKGYLHVMLYDENHNAKCIMIHRLVALAFIPNPNDLPQINHIDENKKNNRVDNLEWVTSEQNINHGTHNKRIGINNPNRKPIYSIDKDNNILCFESAREASKYYKNQGLVITPAGICKALKGEIYTYKGLVWCYQTDDRQQLDVANYFDVQHFGRKQICCIDEENEITHFTSISSALKAFDIPLSRRCSLRKALNTGELFNDRYWFYDS